MVTWKGLGLTAQGLGFLYEFELTFLDCSKTLIRMAFDWHLLQLWQVLIFSMILKGLNSNEKRNLFRI